MIEKSSVSLERTVLVGIITLNQPKHVLEEYLNELNFLTYTAGGTVIKRFTQKMNSPILKLF
jgi:GTP-binding protein HflX